MSADEPPQADIRATTADGSWMLWTLIGLVAIWVAVLVISVFSPDLVSGSEQEHLKVAAFSTWIWGGIGTIGLIWGMGRLRGSKTRQPIWVGLGIVVSVIWLVATVLAVALPVFETGTDPTQIPIAAFVAPLGAALLTVMSSVVAGIFSQGPTPT